MSNHFDRLSKSLGQTISRRRLLTRLSAGLIGGLVATITTSRGKQATASTGFDVRQSALNERSPFARPPFLNQTVIPKPPAFQRPFLNQTLLPKPRPFRVNNRFVR